VADRSARATHSVTRSGAGWRRGRLLGVGIVGARADRGWARRAHLPALHHLPGFELTGVCTSQETSARTAAERFGATRWFTDARALAASPDVDVVVVAVGVPEHDGVVRAALQHSKHVYCEWPLGVDGAEAEQLAQLAAARGIRHVIGLQARASPTLATVRDLIRDGYVGRVETGVAVAAYTGGRAVPASRSRLFDRANGATTLTVAGGHLLDALFFLLGEPETVTGSVATRRPRVTLSGGEELIATAPDTVVAVATLEGGPVVSAHITQGSPATAGTRIDISGSEGVLRVEAADGGIQLAPLSAYGARGDSRALEPIAPRAGRRHVPPEVPDGPSLNVAQALATMGADIAQGTSRSPDFHLAARRHRLLEALERASDSGRSERLLAR
jgi:predicted dehydrogenase